MNDRRLRPAELGRAAPAQVDVLRILVTGCAGFIGAEVTRLLGESAEVVGVDSLNDAYDPRLKEWRLSALRRDGFEFVRADVSDPLQVARLADHGPFDAIVNLAARAGVRTSITDPAPYFSTNVQGTLHLLELARRQGIRKFVLASSSSVYGALAERPFREEATTDLPLSPYAASKKSAEVLAAAYSSLHGIDVAALRFFTVYGPAGRPDMAPFRFVRWISEGEPVVVLGDGHQERDFTYVSDIAAGVVASLRVRGFEAINLGNDRPATLLDLVGVIEKSTGKAARLVHRDAVAADVPKTWANIDKARRLLGWKPSVSLSTGIERTVQWYLANRAWASRIDVGQV